MRRSLSVLCLPIVLLVAVGAGRARTADSAFRVAPLLVMKSVAPGEVVTGRLRVANPSDREVALSVTPRDFTTDSEGKENWLPFGSEPSSLEGWITFAPSYLEIAPGAEAFVDYEIRLPEPSAGEPPPTGSRWSALAIKADRGRRSLAGPPASGPGPAVGMKVALVYAIKIFVDVAGTESRALEAVSLLPGEHPGSLLATFANRGNVVLRPRVWMEVRSLEGAVRGSVEALKWTLPPAGEHRYRFELVELPERLEDGSYQVVVIADYGGSRLEGVAAPLVLRGSGAR